MTVNRRQLVLGTALAGAGLLAAPAVLRTGTATAAVPEGGLPFRPLPELDASKAFELRAQNGATEFVEGVASETKGFNGSYLGPTLRMRRGRTVTATARNRTDAPISTHWHGLNVPSDADGGAPRSAIAPGGTFRAELPVDQPAASLWYHTHVHGRTAADMQAGLAGMLIVDDDASDALGLPSTAGVDDLALIMQDKSFDRRGRSTYDPGMMGVMHGVVGDVVLVNGQLSPVATVPAGMVRLRLVNAGTSALMRLAWTGEGMLIGTDQGLLPTALPVSSLALGPGERAELVLDLSRTDRRTITVKAVHASGMGMGDGMMGGMMRGGRSDNADATGQALIELRASPDLPAVTSLPERLVGEEPFSTDAETRRSFVLATGMGPGNMMRGMLGMQTMTINGEPYDPARIDFTTRRGATEIWRVSGSHMQHPFHAHGVKFRVLDPRRPEETGWKDTVLADGARDLLVKVEAASVDRVPFMFHCHILEHEDAGMMGQFLVA